MIIVPIRRFANTAFFTEYSIPLPGNPKALIIALSFVILITLGFGFPGLEVRVTVPPVTKPNPNFITLFNILQSLSNPAASARGEG